MLLSAYLTKVQRLLHDSNNKFWSQSELTDYINQASAKTVSDTGCLRQLVTTLPPLTVITGTAWAANVVTFTVAAVGSAQIGATFTVTGASPSGYNGTFVVTGVTPTTITAALTSNPGSWVSGGTLVAQLMTVTAQEIYTFPSVSVTVAANQTPTTNQQVIDILNVNIIQGSVRYAMRYMPWTQFNAMLRPWLNYNSLPMFMSVYNQNQLYLGPIPDQPYVMEVDCVYVPPTMVATTDDDTVLYPFNEATPYYAAFLAQMGKQRWQEAQAMSVTYAQRLNQIYEETNKRRIMSPYWR